ncbi:hypothetical protein AVEN_80568-1 [Araneus ventricosus]|uniref:Uncharacterized protein n=1 Tax=Araneus ventricosus TaxID=182803 RepID=A0A4Y2CQM7_ARAVE|nr:hypothetical protein AVEN_80568-1 [Araneus ventricosus]
MPICVPFPLFSSLLVMEDTNDRPLISPLRVPLMTTRPTAFFSPLSEQQPAEIRPTSIEVAWPVTVGLGVRVLIKCLYSEYLPKVFVGHIKYKSVL